MFGQFSKQMKNSSQPASEFFAANVKAMEAVTKQQTLFFSGLVDDSVKLIQTIAQQTEMKDILAAQAVYAESLRERLTSTSTNTYNTISAVSQKYTDAVKSSYETAGEVAKETVKTAPVGKAATVVKAAPVLKAAPAAKAAPVIKPTPVIDATSAVKAELAKTTTKTKQTPRVVAKKPVAKSAAKPVVTLSADEVKAPAKTKADDIKTVSDIKSTPVTKA